MRRRTSGVSVQVAGVLLRHDLVFLMKFSEDRSNFTSSDFAVLREVLPRSTSISRRTSGTLPCLASWASSVV